ncbi:cytospin-A-like isoform X7 [Diorhabda carinulata]|uniref:cytospin-A-like isoform X7 n=1 Tax=Diorhabda carinulata TaxID=1163345 RepID=UPI0025A27936|nr:cytospin-A-like isoform X7 [Diorhabda carinulata]
MGLLDEMFPKKEPTRHRIVKNTPAKKPPDKSTRSSTAEKSTPSQTNSNSSIFNSLRRVQGALSPALKKKSAPKQNAKVNTETKSVEKDTIKDKDKIKEKESDKERKLWFRSSSKVNLRKEPIKSSATSLAVGSGLQKGSSSETKKKRPATVFSDTNVTFRRGQNTKIEGQNLGENNLSRTSSVTNLDAEPKSAKGARPRKSSSRDRLDKIGESKKNDKKGITRNNNKLDSGENPYPSVDSLPEQELSHLRKQLQEMAQEKSNLALQLGEQKGQLNLLQKEIQKLKCFQEESNIQLEHLTEENTALRNRLRDVAHSPLSDNEKQQLLFESHRHHSSAPASIATNIIDDGNGGDTTCTTPDWDKHSSSNVSEVSVACLQDKINQMQETHYSTNEELQATLQELTDLQRQLTELQQENERLNEEKTLMFDSLCRQTERLNDSRSEVESLKQLLYQEKDDTGQFESAVEREQKLVELLKSSQEEREGLLVKIEQLNNEIQESRIGIKEKDEQISQLRDRVRTLECTLDAKHAEHKLLDQELAQAKDQCSGKQIEINRLTDLLDNARTKINELEQDRALSDKSELDELLDNARKEKDSLESEVAHLKEQLAISKNEIEKLKEQVSILQEECKVTRNNAKTTQSDLEYKCEKLLKEKNVLNEQLQEFQEALNELQVQSQCQLEDKRQLSAVLSETQRNLSETEQKNAMLENEVHELKKQRAEENEEWEKFQDDLLTSVRVANDFKTEAQQDLQRMIIENKQYRERERQLKAEIEKLKVVSEPVPLRPSSFPGEEVALRRKNIALSRQNSRQSVKSLIESIESQGKPVLPKTTLNTVSRSSSTSSINSVTSDIRSPSSPSILPTPSPVSPLRTPDWSDINTNVTQTKTPLKEQQPNKLNREWSKNVISESITKNEIVKPKNEDGYRETILQKGIDFSRRNSYSDLSERKDPLNGLVKNGGSKRNALLKWCQNKTVGYRNIDITNFSSSWNDGLALCALLHTYLPDKIPYDSLTPQEKRRNFSLAFSAAESVGVPTTLNITDMIQLERPDWQQVMSYVTALYKHFEA